ncbi:MAG: pyridoxal-dependent decarboxylase [Desulfoprunum sp.]|nr:pyridoxal-dependent decarboxylase [Desulfoprunum sp.]
MNEREVFQRLLLIVEEYYAGRQSGKFLDYFDPDELRQLLQLDHHPEGCDWDRLFDWTEKYLRYAVKTNHPSFVNRMWSGASLPAVVGEIITAISNTSACTFETAPVSTLLEKYMIDQMLEIVGFEDGQGQMTTGSSNANMIAMMCARNLHDPAAKDAGLFGCRRLLAFVSADAHYSMDRAANILGIGLEQLIKVPVNDRGQMDVTVLEKKLVDCCESGSHPFFVAATAGTTVRGAFDPVEPLLVLRARFGFWLHVDGAWGGATVLSERLRPQFLPGLEKADSFTMDFHKMLGSSLICNVLLLNNRRDALARTLSAGDGSYLFRETEDELLDFGPASLQCGRRVDSLKWFLDWKFHGRKGLAARVESFLDLCGYAEECVGRHPELEMMAPRASFNVCFRYVRDEASANDFNLALRTRLYQRGISMVGCAYIEERLVLRLLITNVSMGREDIDRYFAELVAAGREMDSEWRAGAK